MMKKIKKFHGKDQTFSHDSILPEQHSVVPPLVKIIMAGRHRLTEMKKDSCMGRIKLSVMNQACLYSIYTLLELFLTIASASFD